MSSGILTTLVIGTTAYSSTGAAYSGFAGGGGVKSWGSARLSRLRFVGDDEAYSSLEFVVVGCGPAIPIAPGQRVQLVLSYTDGTAPVVKFSGDLQMPKMQPSENGPVWSYTCTDLKRRADYVAVRASNGTPVASYNLSPTDPLYLFSLAGRTVGQIVTDVLQGAAVAAALTALGIGNYTIVSGVYTLPSQTATDLAALSVVPPHPVQIQGESVFNSLEGVIQEFHSQFTVYIQPDGTIRVISIFGRPAHAFTLPSNVSPGDPVDGLNYDLDTDGCYTAVEFTGQDISGTTLSVVDGTLVHAGAAPSSPAWTIADYKTPSNANDQGFASGVGPAGCTVHSDQAGTHWLANYWNGNGGVIVLYNLAAAGVAITETRQVTSCSALTPGGSATIGWDSSLPLDTTSYSRYRLYATSTARSLWDREFFVADPHAGTTGRATLIGSNLYPMFPFPYAWATLGKGANQTSTITYPAAKVLWSSAGAYPWFESSVPVSIDPSRGSIVLSQPAVQVSAGFAGMTGALASGYPTSFFTGLWYDVQVAVPYNRGDLSARAPASSFSGTAYTKYGIARVKTIPLSTYIWRGYTASLVTLANEYLLTSQDAVVTGTLMVHYDAYFTSYLAPFDPFTVGYAIQVNTPGAASDIDGLTLPVRSFTVEWPDSGPDIHRVTFTFSNKHRQFEGDSLYLPNAFSAAGWGTQNDQLFVGGSVGDFAGSTDMGDFHASATADYSSEGESAGGGGEDFGEVGGDAGGGGEDWGLGRSGKHLGGRSVKPADSHPGLGNPGLGPDTSTPRPATPQFASDTLGGGDSGRAIRPDGPNPISPQSASDALAGGPSNNPIQIDVPNQLGSARSPETDPRGGEGGEIMGGGG